MNRPQRIPWWRWGSFLLLLLSLCSPASATPCSPSDELGAFRLHLGLSVSFDDSVEATEGARRTAGDSCDLTIYMAGPERSGFIDYDVSATGGPFGLGQGSVTITGFFPGPLRFDDFSEHAMFDGVLGRPINLHLDVFAISESICSDAGCGWDSGFGVAEITLKFFEAVPDPSPTCPVCISPGAPVRIFYAPPGSVPEPSTWVLMASGLGLAALRRFPVR